MAGSIEIQKQHIKEFYQHKSENPELAGYDEKGNYVFYAKQKESDKGNPKQVTKTIPSIVYRKKTPEELQAEEQASAATIQETIELYTKKRMELFTESTKIGADNKVLHKLNMELAEIDKLLISVRYTHFHIQKYIRNQSNIKMRDIFFENAVEDRKVENDMSMIETRRDSIQREFVPVNDFVSLAEAKTMMSPLGEQVQEAVFNTLSAASAKPATAVKPVKGLPKIGSKSTKAATATAAPAATTAVEPAVTAAPTATTAPAATTAAVTAAPAVTAVKPAKGMPKISSSAVAPSAVPKRISLPAITKSFVSEPAAAAVKPIAEEAAVKPVIKEEL
jgi:molybdopterin converting factor small subunit